MLWWVSAVDTLTIAYTVGQVVSLCYVAISRILLFAVVKKIILQIRKFHSN